MTTRKAPMSLLDAISLAAVPLGGLRAASSAIGQRPGVVSAAANPNKPDMLRLDHAILLDKTCKEVSGTTPILDHYQAALMEVTGPRESFHAHLSNFMRDAADVVSELAGALEDNNISASEREAILGELTDLRSRTSRMIRDLKSQGKKNG